MIFACFRYPNADELRSIVSRLVDRHPHCVSVIGSVELLVRKLYYKFCNERKKYPIELKRRQPNKRKRLLRDDEGTLLFQRHENLGDDFHQSSLDHLMHLWTSTTDYSEEIRVDQQHSSSSSSSSSNGSSHCQETSHSFSKSHPLNLSTSNHLICPEWTRHLLLHILSLSLSHRSWMQSESTISQVNELFFFFSLKENRSMVIKSHRVGAKQDRMEFDLLRREREREEKPPVCTWRTTLEHGFLSLIQHVQISFLREDLTRTRICVFE